MKERSPSPTPKLLIYFGLALATLAVYLPVIYHDYVEYDDQQYVVDNPLVQAGLTWRGFIWAFGFHAGNWHPLAWLSHMLDCHIYGAWAGGQHLTSLLLRRWPRFLPGIRSMWNPWPGCPKEKMCCALFFGCSRYGATPGMRSKRPSRATWPCSEPSPSASCPNPWR
jgi:hypothetical protein